ncbi:MAG: SprT-like domain-containing protein [Chthoniobacterales bacterium]
MPLFRQLELALLGQAPRLPTSVTATDAVGLQSQARALLAANGAVRIARQLRVKWNRRLKTCAGRADYRAKLITLNPQLVRHPGEIDRTLRHELAHLLAQFRAGRQRISPHGREWRQACHDLGIGDEKRCHNLAFAAINSRRRFLYRCPKCARDFPRVRRIRHPVACLACCRAHSRGNFDARFRLRLVENSKRLDRRPELDRLNR